LERASKLKNRKREWERGGEKGDRAIDIVLKLGYDLSNFQGQSRAPESARLNIALS